MTTAYNLSALADALRSGGTHKVLIGRIERWAQRNSRLTDLRHARELLSQVNATRSQLKARPVEVSQVNPIGDIQAALFAHAVILYARATLSGDGGRQYGINVGKKYSIDQKRVHGRIVDLRNRAITHYDDNDSQDWLRHIAILLVHNAESWEYGFSYSYVSLEGVLLFEFSSLLDYVIPILQQELKEECDAVHDAMTEAFNQDDAFQSRVKEFAFDAEKFFGPGTVTDRLAEAILVPGSSFEGTVNYPAGDQ